MFDISSEKFIILFFIFVLGTIIGSFLNVVIYRINTGRGFGGRSMCFSCNRTLTPFELFPIFSFLFQKGRCAKCKTKLSWQYPLVEFFTGVLFVLSFIQTADIPNLIFVCIIMSILMVIIVYDIKHKIIPDQCSYLLAILTFLRILPHFSLSALAAGPLLALPFYLIWLVSNGRWMGLGDAKLSLGLGWFVAAYTVNPLISDISIFLYAFWVGTLFFIFTSLLGVIIRSLTKRHNFLPVLGFKSEIPFAPFLIIGLFIVFLFRYNIASLIFNNYFI